MSRAHPGHASRCPHSSCAISGTTYPKRATQVANMPGSLAWLFVFALWNQTTTTGPGGRLQRVSDQHRVLTPGTRHRPDQHTQCQSAQHHETNAGQQDHRVEHHHALRVADKCLAKSRREPHPRLPEETNKLIQCRQLELHKCQCLNLFNDIYLGQIFYHTLDLQRQRCVVETTTLQISKMRHSVDCL